MNIYLKDSFNSEKTHEHITVRLAEDINISTNHSSITLTELEFIKVTSLVAKFLKIQKKLLGDRNDKN